VTGKSLYTRYAEAWCLTSSNGEPRLFEGFSSYCRATFSAAGSAWSRQSVFARTGRHIDHNWAEFRAPGVTNLYDENRPSVDHLVTNGSPNGQAGSMSFNFEDHLNCNAHHL
jgi:hypothetical protein